MWLLCCVCDGCAGCHFVCCVSVRAARGAAVAPFPSGAPRRAASVSCFPPRRAALARCSLPPPPRSVTRCFLARPPAARRPFPPPAPRRAAVGAIPFQSHRRRAPLVVINKRPRPAALGPRSAPGPLGREARGSSAASSRSAYIVVVCRARVREARGALCRVALCRAVSPNCKLLSPRQRRF